MAQVSYARRCFPTTDNGMGKERQLCGSPKCDEIGRPCAVVPSQPSVLTTWQILDKADEALCRFQVWCRGPSPLSFERAVA